MENNRILQNNKISHFILRIDFTKDIQIDYKMLSESLKDEFATFKTELHSNYNVSIASALNFNKLQKYTSNVHQIQETAQNSLTSQAI